MGFVNGVYNRIYNWVNDANSNINITASRMDGEDNGFASGLSQCLLKDGTQTVTANIPFAGFKITGLGNGSAVGDSATIGQLQNNNFSWVVSGGTADAITASYNPAVTTLVDGMELDFRATAANATTTPTFNPNGLGAYTITQNGGAALSAGNIPGANFEGKLRLNLTNTRWELMNPKTIAGASNPFSDATALVKNSADATKQAILSAASIATGTTRTYTLPNSNGTFLTTGAAVTVAQGGTGLATLTANNVILGNGTSNPNFVAPGSSGNVLTSNGTTWQSSTPASAGIFTKSYLATGQTITSGGSLTIAHGMGVAPLVVVTTITCTSAENNYSAGDELVVSMLSPFQAAGGTACGGAITFDSTNIYVRFTSQTNVFSEMMDKNAGTNCLFTNSKWNLNIKVFA